MIDRRRWADVITDERMAEAKRVYLALTAIDGKDLTAGDRALREALGYLCLELDDVDLAGLTESDLGSGGGGK